MAASYQRSLGYWQLMLPLDAQRIGGWNTRSKHVYAYKPKTTRRGSVVAKYRFRKMENPRTAYRWWPLYSAISVGAFQDIVVVLASVLIPGVEFGAPKHRSTDY